MNITEQQLTNAAKALGVVLLLIPGRAVFTQIIQYGTKHTPIEFGPGFAEWAVPVLEERHEVFIEIWRGHDHEGMNWFAAVEGGLMADGPDIDTAVFLLAAKIGEGME